jgi:ribonuclease M5
MIKEVIVVEGKDDIAAVKKAVDAEIISTSGFGLNPKILGRIKSAAERCGIIILTDPDYAGERIRRTVSKQVPGAKHAFVPRVKATKDGDIGVENASPEAIREALSKVKTEVSSDRQEFTAGDMMDWGLTGGEGSAARRDLVGRELGIGYGNSKQFLNRLNRYGVTREEFNEAVKKLNEVEQ